MELGFLEEGNEWRLPDLLYADDLVLCCELEEYLKLIGKGFVGVYKRMGQSKCR